MHTLPSPYLVFLGDETRIEFAKTALGLRDWAPEKCVGEWHLMPGTITTGLPAMRPAEAVEKGVKALVLGVAAQGGKILDSWVPAIVEAMDAGLDIISGQHDDYRSHPDLLAAVERTGRQFIEVRRPPENLPIGTGAKRSGKRILTVGTDCALGKKYTALALTRSLKANGVKATFRPSGQTGIMIAGEGLPMDSVISDFLTGAAESLSPANDDDHWDVIEGQGSLAHPAYAPVTLGLIHGSQPDVLILCHQPGRDFIVGTNDQYRVPTLEEAIDQNVAAARFTNPSAVCRGVSLNSAHMDEASAFALMDEWSERLMLPVADPMRPGAHWDRLVEEATKLEG